MYCGACGEGVIDKSKFCANCGSTVDIIASPVTSVNLASSQTSDYQRPSTPTKMPIDHNVERTGWLSFVIVMHYIGLILLILLGVFTIFLSFFLGVLILLGAWFNYWLLQGLKNYDNTRRGIIVVLQVIGFIIILFSFDIFSLALGGLEIYALAFHAPTVRLFDHQIPEVKKTNLNYYEKHHQFLEKTKYNRL